MTTYTPTACISVLHGDHQAVVSVDGEIDMTSSDAFRERVVEAGATGVKTIVIDLRGASFLDSTGLGVLVGTAARVAHHGAEIVLREPSAQVSRVLAITGLAPRFRVVA